MKPAQIKELRKRLSGQVVDAKDVLDYFATDGSVFKITPTAVIYPKQEADVQAAAAYATEQSIKGRSFSLIGRGKGTDQSGGALGSGAMVVFPAHLNAIKAVSKDTVTVQPGAVYRDLQRILATHRRFLPPYPSSIDYSTIGGAIANNASGEMSYKYGSTAAWVTRLRVVLDDGTVIETKRISKRELNRKKGIMSREGDLYRGIDGLIQDHKSLIDQSTPSTSKNSAGYRLGSIKGTDGSFDLSQLFIGAQGTLGLITQATLKTAPYEPRTTLVVGFFDNLERAGEAVLKLRSAKPAAAEMVDRHLLEFVRKHRPGTLENLIGDKTPELILLVEFDNPSHLRQNLLSRRAERIFSKFATTHTTTQDRRTEHRLWALRESAAAVLASQAGTKKALPIIEDGCVPVERLPEFVNDVYRLFKRNKLDVAVWGHAGDANLHLQPFLDLGRAKDRKLVFKIMDEFYDLVIKFGGTTTAEHNDGMLRAPYLEKLYGRDMYHLFEETKRICDPRGIFNPEIKLGVKKKSLESKLRQEYSLSHFHDHTPCL